MWRGVAEYRAGNYQEAINAFAIIDSPESWYNQGNALMHLKKFDDAVSAYEKALQANPKSEDIQANLATAKRLLQAQQKEEQDQAEDPDLKPDSVQFDDKGKEGKDVEIAMSEQTSQMWIKNIAVSPAAMLARRFRLRRKAAPNEGSVSSHRLRPASDDPISSATPRAGTPLYAPRLKKPAQLCRASKFISF